MTKLKKTSISTKLYMWVYNREVYELPTNLCPFFWKTIFAYILSIIVGTLSLPILLITGFGKFMFTSYIQKSIASLSQFTLAVYVITWFAWCYIAAISLFFNTYSNGSLMEAASSIGLILWFGTIVFILIRIIELYRKHLSNKRWRENGLPKKQVADNIIIEFIKSKYKKYCPSIEWID